MSVLFFFWLGVSFYLACVEVGVCERWSKEVDAELGRIRVLHLVGYRHFPHYSPKDIVRVDYKQSYDFTLHASVLRIGWWQRGHYAVTFEGVQQFTLPMECVWPLAGVPHLWRIIPDNYKYSCSPGCILLSFVRWTSWNKLSTGENLRWEFVMLNLSCFILEQMKCVKYLGLFRTKMKTEIHCNDDMTY